MIHFGKFLLILIEYIPPSFWYFYSNKAYFKVMKMIEIDKDRVMHQ